jgi:hypothetical protein
MFKDKPPAWHAKADQLLETAIDSSLEMAAAVDHLDENEAVYVLAYSILALDVPREFLAAAVAGLSVRLRRISTRGPVPSPE